MNISAFQNKVWNFYETHKRDLPWRKNINPYRILVSEYMLQQTQVSRVLTYYPNFLKHFPTIKHLAEAPLSSVLKTWQGLGYNRRALALRKTAEIITQKYSGKVPNKKDILISLPGIGDATAGAVLAYAHNVPNPFIETNIRRVFIHHFFSQKRVVSDKELMPIITASLPSQNQVRDWYWALMDYGSYLGAIMKKQNPNRKSKHYTKQSIFTGSDREIRGRVIALLIKKPLSLNFIAQSLSIPQDRLNIILQSLVREEMLVKKQNKFSIAS